MNGTESTVRSPAAAQAAEWLTAMQVADVSARQCAQFAEWLTRSPENVHEYLQSAALWHDLGTARLARDGRDELIAAARRDAAGGNVVALERYAQPPGAVRTRLWPRWGIALTASLLLAVIVSLGWREALPRWHGRHYETEVGEQTSFMLSDGSVVRLNTRSALRVRMKAGAREIELLRGEALFDVAEDSARPFRVNAGSTTIQALGTVFNVYRHVDDATVTVIEGKVQIASATADASQVLEPREQARVSHTGSIVRAREVDLDQVTAWKDRRLVFTGSTLEEVTAQFNRYNVRQLRVGDVELAQIRINAVFNAADSGSLVEFLERTERVSVHRDDDGVDVLRRRP